MHEMTQEANYTEAQLSKRFKKRKSHKSMTSHKCTVLLMQLEKEDLAGLPMTTVSRS